jgi:hypothetical protein
MDESIMALSENMMIELWQLKNMHHTFSVNFLSLYEDG